MDYLSIYLEAAQFAKLPKGWNRDVKFKLVVFNQINSNMTIAKGIFASFVFSFCFIVFPPFNVRRFLFSFSVLYFGILLG